MTYAQASSIRDQTTALLTERVSLPEFQDWLVGATWDIEQQADPEAADLAYGAKLALAELSRGDISHAVFRDRMRDLVGMPAPAR